jgi:hypothetical protein
MKTSPEKEYAVITGDIVGSSKLPKAQRRVLTGLLQEASRETMKAFSKDVPFAVDVFRGDSWQLLVSDPTQSLRVGLFFRACLRSQAERGQGLDTRMAIAVGRVDFVRGRVSQGDGEAYRLSGRGLESLPRKQRLGLAFPAGGQREAVSVIVRLIDALAQEWTGKQATAIRGALRGWTQEKIAKSWPEKISQQAVTKHLEGAKWPAVEGGLAYVEYNLQRL